MKRAGWACAAVTAALASVPLVGVATELDASDLGVALTGVAWDGPSERLFAVSEADQFATVRILDGDGQQVDTTTFAGDIRSVQALALWEDNLYVADIGDPDATRDFVTVFEVAAEAGRQRYRAWDLRYPDGPRDAAAFGVSGKGRFYVVTRGEDPAIYRARSVQPSRNFVNELVRVTDAPDGVSDAVFLPDGVTLAMRTARGIELIDLLSVVEQDSTTYVDAPGSESITNYDDGQLLVGAAEFRAEPVPAGNSTVTPVPPTLSPTASSSPSVNAEGPPSPSPVATVVVNEPGGVSRRGTILALVGAAALSVVAGVVVYVSKD